MGRWFDEIPSTAVLVDCGGDLHRVSWSRGKLVLHDHRLRDEEVFLALGGAPPPCMALLLTWRDRKTWAATSRPHPPGFVRRMRPPDAPAELAAIRRLGVVRAWERQWRRTQAVEEAEDIYRLLRNLARPHVIADLDAQRSRVGGGPPTFVEVRLAKPGERAAVEGRVDPQRSSLVVTLLPSWLYEVDVTGATTEDGSFRVSRDEVLWWRQAANARWEAALRQASWRRMPAVS